MYFSAGAIVCQNASPVIRDCSFSDFYANGAMALSGSAAVVEDCVFLNNESGCSACKQYQNGGAVNCSDGSTAIFRRCTFEDNYVEYPPRGGAVAVEGASPTFEECSFVGNQSRDAGGAVYCSDSAAPHFIGCSFLSNVTQGIGGAVACDGAMPSFDSCIFAGNMNYTGLPILGGAIHCANGSSVSIENCTLVGNSNDAYPDSAAGTVAYVADSSQAVFGRCILAYNDYGCPIACEEDASVSIECSDVFGNHGGNWDCCLEGYGETNNNFSADPEFCGGEDGYGLRGSSPCTPEHSPCGELVGVRLDMCLTVARLFNERQDT
jgi:predicted outer membrane repeat protein